MSEQPSRHPIVRRPGAGARSGSGPVATLLLALLMCVAAGDGVAVANDAAANPAMTAAGGETKAPPGRIAPSVRQSLLEHAKSARQSGGEACATSILHQGTKFTGLSAGSLRASGSLRALVGGRNFTIADLDLAEVPFYTPINGAGLTPLLHDGGEWPGTGGNPEADDGRASFGYDQAGEIYDLDRNGHHPKAVLRYIGQHCYIFVPMMFFPTLPRGIDINETITPAPKPEWGMTWPDSPGMGETIYFAQSATGAKVIDPRFVLGADKGTARLNLKALADEFDYNIYPKMREWFGTEPDIDGDSKVFILLDDIRDGQGTYRGYFYAVNQFPRTTYSISNEKELMHIDLFPSFVMNPQQTYGTVAHEFVHMIHFNEGSQIVNGQLEGEETWLEEGFTQFGQYLFNKIHTSNLDAFIQQPETILVEDRQSVWGGSNPFPNYGASYAFMFYLIEKFGGGVTGGQRFMRNLFRDKATGIQSINNQLAGMNVTFTDVFSNWVLCNIINKTRKLDGSPLQDGLWGYNQDNDFDTTNDMGQSQRFPVKFSEHVILSQAGTARSGNLKPWAADYIDIQGNSGNVTMGFDGDDGVNWRCAVIKRGKEVDPAVEYIYLNQRQAGSLYIQNYGTGNPYEKMILVPSIQEGGGSLHENNNFYPLPPPSETPRSYASVRATPIYGIYPYVWSAVFANLKVALFPNPVYENELHVIVRTTDKFASTPRVQMTYNGTQGYLTMTAVNDQTFIGNYRVTESGEGTIEANGTNSNGVILTNHLRFTATYYPPRSEGALMASFGGVRVPAGALRQGGLVILAHSEPQPSLSGLRRVGSALDLELPLLNAGSRVALSVPRPTDAPEHGVGLFRLDGAQPRFVGPATVEVASLTGGVAESGLYAFAVDDQAPVVGGEAQQAGNGWVRVAVADVGAGIDGASLRASIDGSPLGVRYDAGRGLALIDTSTLPSGNHPLTLQVADGVGNVTTAAVRAQIANEFETLSFLPVPNPARSFAAFRAAFRGAAAARLEVEITVRDLTGARVARVTSIPHQGGGEYVWRWDLRNDDGQLVANGVYLVEMRASGGDTGEVKRRTRVAVAR